jgi:hypothetical protein
LGALNAAVREFSPEGLEEMRRRFVAKREHAAVVRILEAELRRRDCTLVAPIA